MYKLSYDPAMGKVDVIIRLSDTAHVPLCPDNTDFQQFLEWNKAQKVPLDLDSTIGPVKPEPARDVLKELDALKAQVGVNIAKLK